MKTKFYTLFSFALVSLIIVSFSLVDMVRADSTDTVAATVTAVIYSVSLDNGDGIAFGTVAQSSDEDTTTAGVNDSTTATNDGSVAAKFNIKSTNSTGGAGWTLGSDPGSETFGLNFCTSNCDSSPVWSSVGLHPSYATLAASVNASSTQVFDLQIETPTSTTVTAEQSITVTVQAVQP